MCLGNSGPVQAMGAMANGKTNRRQTTRRKRVNFDGGGEDEDASSNDEEEEEKERDGITLEDLHACVLDSECAAAKKFGCGTTRFKTICRKLGIARWPHRKLHSLLEMYKSLAGYYKELCEKTTLEPCPQRQSKRMEEVHIVRKDLVHLRNYALKVERNLLLLNPYHNASKPWPDDILRIRAKIYKHRHVQSKSVAAKKREEEEEEEKKMVVSALPSSTMENTNISSTAYSSARSAKMSATIANAAVGPPPPKQQLYKKGAESPSTTQSLTSDAETNTYLNNLYPFSLAQANTTTHETSYFDDPYDDQQQYHIDKLGHMTTLPENSEYSSGSGVDFFNSTTSFNNNNNNNNEHSVAGTKRKRSGVYGQSNLGKEAVLAAMDTITTEEDNTTMPTNLELDLDLMYPNESIENAYEDATFSPSSFAIMSLSSKKV